MGELSCYVHGTGTQQQHQQQQLAGNRGAAGDKRPEPKGKKGSKTGLGKKQAYGLVTMIDDFTKLEMEGMGDKQEQVDVTPKRKRNKRPKERPHGILELLNQQST